MAIAVGLAMLACAPASHAGSVGRVTGLPVPRFVTVKTHPANVRAGPGRNYPVRWTFVRRDVPVEIIAEFGNWRRIRDWSGKQGWMLGVLLSGRRTGIVAPWTNAEPVRLRAEPRGEARTVAVVEPKVFARIVSCDGTWCRVRVKARTGYIRQTRLWGAYPGETVQ